MIKVTAINAIKWTCGHCNRENTDVDSLEETPEYGFVRSDHIECQFCGRDNHVVMDDDEMNKIILVQQIGDDVCSGCTKPYNIECGREAENCSRIKRAVRKLDEFIEKIQEG